MHGTPQLRPRPRGRDVRHVPNMTSTAGSPRNASSEAQQLSRKQCNYRCGYQKGFGASGSFSPRRVPPSSPHVPANRADSGEEKTRNEPILTWPSCAVSMRRSDLTDTPPVGSNFVSGDRSSGACRKRPNAITYWLFARPATTTQCFWSSERSFRSSL
jgi:hypothetical protein